MTQRLMAEVLERLQVAAQQLNGEHGWTLCLAGYTVSGL